MILKDFEDFELLQDILLNSFCFQLRGYCDVCCSKTYVTDLYWPMVSGRSRPSREVRFEVRLRDWDRGRRLGSRSDEGGREAADRGANANLTSCLDPSLVT